MLFRRIDRNSIPYGLAVAGEDIVKGSAVVIVRDATKPNGVKAMLPTSEAEAKAVKGFATFRIEEEGGADKDFEVIKAGKWVVIYTLVKDNMWGTTQFVGTPSAGDNLVVGYTDATDKGKLRALTAGEVTAQRPAQFVLEHRALAGEGYTDSVIDVTVL